MITKSSFTELGSLTPIVIIQLNTPAGYMQLLEYTLQDYSLIHVVQWHFVHILEEDSLTPVYNCTVFYKDKYGAIERAAEIGRELFKCI